MSRQALTKHLAALVAAGLVRPRRDGREVRYEVMADHLAAAATWLSDVGRRWDQRIDALRKHLEAG